MNDYKQKKMKQNKESRQARTELHNNSTIRVQCRVKFVKRLI